MEGIQSPPRPGTQEQESPQLRPGADPYTPVNQLQPDQQPHMQPAWGPRGTGTSGVTARVAGTALTSIGYSNKEATLQTAKVYLKKPDGSLVEATAVFDTGASSSYITKGLAKVIKPPTSGRDWISYGSFGGERCSNPQLSTMYNVELLNKAGVSHPAVLAEVPVICPPLSRRGIPNTILEGFEKLPLADSYGKSECYKMDILIGGDQYWDFIVFEWSKSPRMVRLINVSSLVDVGSRPAMGTTLSHSWRLCVKMQAMI